MNWLEGAHEFADALATSAPTPGGGAAAAMTGAMGCALAMMALGTTLKRKSTPAQNRPALENHLQQFAKWHSQLKMYIEQDATVYEEYIAATKLSKEDPNRAQAVQKTLWQAAIVPALAAIACAQALKEMDRTYDLIDPIILSDAVCAKHLLLSARTCCMENFYTNKKYIKDTDYLKDLKGLEAQFI